MNERFEDDDLRDLLDSSFGSGPAHRPVHETVARGRRGLLRRRIGTGVAAAAVLVAIGGTFALTTGGSSPTAGIEPADSPTSEPVDCEALFGTAPSLGFSSGGGSASGSSGAMSSEITMNFDESTTELPGGPDTGDPGIFELPSPNAGAATVLPDGFEECFDDSFTTIGGYGSSSSGPIGNGRSGDLGADVDLDARGRLHHADGVEVVRTVDNPLDVAAPDRSMAVEYTRAGTTYWALLDFTRDSADCGTWNSTISESDGGSLEEWLAEQPDSDRATASGSCLDLDIPVLEPTGKKKHR